MALRGDMRIYGWPTAWRRGRSSWAQRGTWLSSWRTSSGHADTLVALFERFPEKNLWTCFDTGHFNLFTKVPLDASLGRLRAGSGSFIYTTTTEKSDEHLPVGRGTFPFRELKRLLRPTDNLYFTAEASSESSAREALRCASEFLS